MYPCLSKNRGTNIQKRLENAHYTACSSIGRKLAGSSPGSLLLPEHGIQFFLHQGEYSVCAGEKTWPCEPNGITIRYFRQKPLGALLAAIVTPNDGENSKLEGFNKPIVVGNSVQFVAPQSGALWFKINRLPNATPADGSVIKIIIEELP